MIKIKGNKLFNNAEIDNYIEKFKGKTSESNNKIEQLNADILKYDVELDIALEADILEATSASKNALQNITARKGNAQASLDVEMKKLLKIKEIMMSGLAKLIPSASNQMKSDLAKYMEIVDHEIYKQLLSLKQEQEKLLLTLQMAHDIVISDSWEFDTLCNFAEMPSYKRNMSNENFQQNMYVCNRSFPEYGSPLLNSPYLSAIVSTLERERADANAIINVNLPLEDRHQLPASLNFNDIDLQEFLDSIGKSDER
jgi:hypothetical protein